MGLAAFIDAFNLRIPGRRWQLLEVEDLKIPSFVRHDLLDISFARWTHRLLSEKQTAAEIAAETIDEAFDNLPDADSTAWTAIDFGSGQGGPVPAIEKLVNWKRRSAGKRAIPFQLSDIEPNLNAWIPLASESESLSFIPQPVDAANPTFAAISTTTAGDREAALDRGFETHGRKVFRLFCTSFSQFDDQTATKVLKSTLDTSDGFAIIELRERTLFSMAMAVVETLVLLLMGIVWFWRDRTHLFFTYTVPILPLTELVDELVSCLRVRTFAEIILLARKAEGHCKADKLARHGDLTYIIDGWEFKNKRLLYSWPGGYMSVCLGRRVSLESRAWSESPKRVSA